MNSLQAQKKLLIAESELSRVQLKEDAVALTNGVREMLDRTKSWGTLASAAAVLVAGVVTFRRRHKGKPAAPSSRLKSVINGAGLLLNLWSAYRTSHRSQAQRPPPDHL